MGRRSREPPSCVARDLTGRRTRVTRRTVAPERPWSGDPGARDGAGGGGRLWGGSSPRGRRRSRPDPPGEARSRKTSADLARVYVDPTRAGPAVVSAPVLLKGASETPDRAGPAWGASGQAAQGSTPQRGGGRPGAEGRNDLQDFFGIRRRRRP